MSASPGKVEPTCAEPDRYPVRPSFALPAQSCDSHCHVFGPHSRFPYAAERHFTPPDAPKERLQAMQDFLGFDRAVIVQSNCHGFDHSAMLDAVRSRPGRYRGVALLTPASDADTVRRLDDQSVCGVRIALVSHFGGPPPPADVLRIAQLVAPFDWHVELHVGGDDVVRHFDLIAALECRVVIDHLGRVNIEEGLESPAVESLVALLDRGTVWIKLSAPERISRMPYPYPDAIALAQLLAAHAPDRVLWGTDYPHPNLDVPMPNDGRQVDLIPLIAPTVDAQQRLLVDNPAEVFGFARD